MADSRCVSLLVHGRVQGVFYRANARKAARRLDLRGWVRNNDDGTVAALACGAGKSIEEFIAWCHRGSPAARVDRVEVREAEPDAVSGDTFEALH